ncbi:hypothetical protein L1887_20485 [Cichorium endivia]|nr:hypothetical protein L1887_20485 [Cichorium endivia]
MCPSIVNCSRELCLRLLSPVNLATTISPFSVLKQSTLGPLLRQQVRRNIVAGYLEETKTQIQFLRNTVHSLPKTKISNRLTTLNWTWSICFHYSPATRGVLNEESDASEGPFRSGKVEDLFGSLFKIGPPSIKILGPLSLP